MILKKLCKIILFPHVTIMLILIPIATAFLSYSMIFSRADSVSSIISYILAAYTLTVWSIKLPYLIRLFKNFKNENKYARIWQDDTGLRINISLYGTLIWNTAYAVFQLGLGFWYRSFWYYSLACYYVFLATMRFFLVRHSSKHKCERICEELIRYRSCGIMLLVTNIILALIVFFMVYWDRTFIHHEITTIAMAAYTFTAFTIAIINIIRYQKYNSPVYSATKAISLAAASVSMLTLESTMFTTFNDGTLSILTRKILLGSGGAVVSVFIIIMAIYMIVQSNNKLKTINRLKEM